MFWVLKLGKYQHVHASLSTRRVNVDTELIEVHLLVKYFSAALIDQLVEQTGLPVLTAGVRNALALV